MNVPSRTGRRAAALAASLLLGGCVSTATPSAQPSVVLVGEASSSTPASAAATPSPSLDPGSTASIESEPGGDGEPSEEPTATPSPIPGCGPDILANRDEVPESLHFGGATIEFTTAGIRMRDGSEDADDAIPGGIGLSRNEIAVVVGPGDHIILRGDGMEIADPRGSVVSWATVDFSGGLGQSAADPVALVSRPRADGSVSISAPDQVGDWMVAFVPQWQTKCLAGDGTAYSRIKVR